MGLGLLARGVIAKVPGFREEETGALYRRLSARFFSG